MFLANKYLHSCISMGAWLGRNGLKYVIAMGCWPSDFLVRPLEVLPTVGWYLCGFHANGAIQTQSRGRFASGTGALGTKMSFKKLCPRGVEKGRLVNLFKACVFIEKKKWY